MKNILKNKWHLHFIIAGLTMSILMWLFMLTNLREWESFLCSIIILFIGCVYWEIRQNAKLRHGEKQSEKTQIEDVLAGVTGGVFVGLLFFIC